MGFFGWVFYCQPCMEVDLAGGATGEPQAGGESTGKLVVCGVTCLPQRAALLKSMLNFLKKAIQGWGNHTENTKIQRRLGYSRFSIQTKSMDFRRKKNLDSYCFVASFGHFIFEKNDVIVPSKSKQQIIFFLN